MKFSLTQSLVMVLFIGVSYAHETSAQEYLNRRLSIKAEGKEVKKVLVEIEKATDVRFVYSSQVIAPTQKVTLNVTNSTLDEVLRRLFSQIHVKYEVVGRKVVLSSIPAPPSGSLNPESDRKLAANNALRAISGTVTDETGNGLPGVSVVQKGTQRGTTTNAEGKFQLDIPDNSAILVFSFVGYQSKEVAIGGESVLSIQMTPELKSLEEVVVVGYGTQRKSDLTGAVGTVKGETLQERPVASLNQALSGRITGVNVSINSGRPGGRANIRIRGNTSVSVANNPLYVIDGVILNAADLANGSTPIDYINPNDIASIEVLKDASATAIYGARGANGVILVTTKRGSQDGGRVNYDTDYGIGVLPRKIPLLNSEEFLRVEEIAYQNAKKYDPVGWAGGKYTDPKTKRTNPLLFDANGKPLYNTDWQDEAFRQALIQNHQLSFAGGNGKDSYGAYLGYRNEEGLMH